MIQSIENELSGRSGETSRQSRRRNKGFEETHLVLIETAVKLVSAKGMEALSLSEVAREAGVNRTTIYYHFADREALINAIRKWSAQQLTAVLSSTDTAEHRGRSVIRYVLENPEVVALWTEDFLSPGRISDRYAMFDGLTEELRVHFETEPMAEGLDAEVFATFMLTWVLAGARVYRNSVQPEASLDEAVERLTGTHMAILRLCGLVKG
ncbi:TetR family transcriptional regulator [Novosphingobium sp. PhB165]|uniref:TetR/AcrR family transcriptional regulator n=1 Tax=Novosphingobium sp. PhB165 TaxID=2485105 RepID=UPI00104928C0|nr:TetR/AcrR family transcriptional regulator [Novosphingobium sp. PhB165]TCM15052.1 TetR family transcriptional regulator [Novosphingobium sp. PhB165]